MAVKGKPSLADLRRTISELEAELDKRSAERDEGLAREAAVAELLQVVNSSSGDLATVFDAILEKAHRLCGAEYGVLLTYDGELFWPAAIHGAQPGFPERREGLRPGFGFTGLVRGERFLHIEDMAEVAAQRPDDPVPRRLVENGIRTQLAVPLRKAGKLLGIITANRREVRPFSDKHIQLLENFAAQAVIAMENARLLTETREALEQQTATAEVLQVINSSPGDLAPVFDAILEKAHTLCDAKMGGLATFDGEQFRFVATHGVPDFVEYSIRPSPNGNTPLDQLTRGEPLIHLADARTVDAYREVPGFRSFIDTRGVRTFILVSLRKDGALLGAVGAYRQEVQPFTDKQIALLQNFAAQAVIAMENARLITETREALEQQTATAEVLQVINSSPGDLAPVFDAMLEKAMRLCEAAFGALRTYDGNSFRAVAVHGVPEPFAEFYAHNPPSYGPGTGPARLLSGEPFVHVADLASEESYLAGEPNRRALVDLGGARTSLAVPLRKDDMLVGFIMIYRQEVRPFSDKQIALLQNFAAQAVIAIENARLLTETREALEQQTATAEVLQVINSSPGDLAPVFDALLEKAVHVCEAAFGDLGIFDGEQYRWVAAHGIPDFAEYSFPLRPDGNAPLEQLTRGERLVHLADVRQSETYREFPAFKSTMDHRAVRSLLVVPLRKDGALLGAIRAYRREVRPFTDKQIALLQNFAAQAVIAMENARLITETREALEQQTATAEVLQVINSSPGDLAPVFDAMLEKATRLCEASFGILWSFTDDLAVAGALHQVPEAYAELCRAPFRPSPGSGPARMMRGENGFALADLKEYRPYLAGDALTRAIVDFAGARSVVIEPLRKDGVTLGAITLYRQEVRPFSDKQIALLQNFAAQAVIAMENARLLTETREALEQQTATAEVLQVINSSPGDLAPVFDAILEKAHALCGVAYGALAIYDGETFRAVAVNSASDAFAERLREGIRAAGNPIGQPLVDGARFVHIPDQGEIDHPVLRAATEQTGARTVLAVPLRKDNVLLGAITAVREAVRPFSDKQIALLQNFAAQAVIAMENARLFGELRQRTEEVAELNRGLEARVAEQVEELGRVGRLKRFLAPQLAELIVSQGDEKILESHRREIVVVFCDLRGYTAFTETAEPEEVLDFLREYHGALGPLVAQFEGTLDQFSGDGIMVFFNDPVPIPDPAERAVKMAMAMREAAGKLITDWRRHSYELGFGAGIAQGYATLGQIGFSERSGYTAIGTVCNLAARLCAEAKDGQILVSSRIAGAVEAVAKLEDLGNLELKGLSRPVAAFNVTELINEAPV